jgi:hypothetical protein
VIRRYSFALILCLLLIAFSHTLVAQVYPDRQELDVVRLVDGTVLKGVILEEVPERYLEIQLYGGSTFVLGFEQIESVEQEANPDYGTRWIKIDLGAKDPESAATGGADKIVGANGDTSGDPAPDAGPRPLSEGGHLVAGFIYGLLSTFDPPFRLPIDTGGLASDGLDETLTEEDQEESSFVGAGLAYTWWRPLQDAAPAVPVWGLRGTVGYSDGWGRGKGQLVDSSEGPQEPNIAVGVSYIPLIAEGLIGIAGKRAAVLVGAGLGIGITTGNSQTEYYYDDSYTTEPLTITQPVTPLYGASLTGLIYLGQRWVLEAGLWASGQFATALEKGYIVRGWGERIAIGYRFGGK